ncbi:hypothetical protein [Sinomicrobium weinanense]|uniref:DUF4468 domain-containing protein n=1 Tax=Sinomicrobium weinanense TaxID=2842200 RepID=A0A926JVZ6_9FLAO|nr:hypothetical protein [Sinomicrobium weinanense]MBC9798598.1 hypothetical protein [Sinomicrobium weinanense]MBU3123499.1 hypothetical protein [Sinomicrobium weinanense]
MKRIIFVFALFSIMLGSAQSSVDGYKYVIVPQKFDFLKKENQYQVNALTKFLFEKYNFKAVYANHLTTEVEENSCLALKADVKDNSNMFTTRLNVELTNCRGEVIFTSEEGKSKEKDFKTAYHDALRKAFKSVEELNYNYDPSISIVSSSRATATAPPAQASSVAPSRQQTTEQPKVVEKTENPVPVARKAGIKNDGVLYAQPVENGYQLVDSSPKVIFVLQKTSADNVYIIRDKNGMLTKKDGKWIAEYYEGGERIEEELKIKF